MRIERPDTGVAGDVADLWVALAREQRPFGSHLRAERNRPVIREALVRHIIADGLLVARTEGDLVGFVMYGPESERYEQDVSRGIVRNLVVSPGHRNEGIGAALLAAAETALAEAGFEVVALSALAGNEAARRFYTRQGYREHRVELEKPLESDTHKSDGE